MGKPKKPNVRHRASADRAASNGGDEHPPGGRAGSHDGSGSASLFSSGSSSKNNRGSGAGHSHRNSQKRHKNPDDDIDWDSHLDIKADKNVFLQGLFSSPMLKYMQITFSIAFGMLASEVFLRGRSVSEVTSSVMGGVIGSTSSSSSSSADESETTDPQGAEILDLLPKEVKPAKIQYREDVSSTSEEESEAEDDPDDVIVDASKPAVKPKVEVPSPPKEDSVDEISKKEKVEAVKREKRKKRMELPFAEFMKKKVDFPKPPDTRPNTCGAKVPKYDVGNQTVSIVIPYLKEKFKHIRGTIGSILAHTPAKLLAEIVFISDGNSDADAHEDKILALQPGGHPSTWPEAQKKQRRPLIRVIRLPHRHGLIYAKTLGARKSLGEVIMFFEPHCIVNKNWLEPLLHVLLKRPNSLILPILDYIPQSNFNHYSEASVGRYRFEWNFNLIYTNPPASVDQRTDVPFFAPATSGGIFAMTKRRFLELNLFDVGMKQWGGDQIELSFKAWRCGGSIIVVPCSRVGHLFRDPEHRPYPVDIPQVVENYSKLARVWLEDPYLEKAFYVVKPEARQMALNVDLFKPKKKFKQLECKSMKWYIENVDLELGWEFDRICIPGADKRHPVACKGPAVPGRSCTNHVMSAKEYERWSDRSEAQFFAKEGWAKHVGELLV